MKRLLCAFVALLMVPAVVGPAQAADRSIGEKMDDTKITAAVKTKLAADRGKNLVDVGVETNDGIVRLYGKSPTPEDKFEAESVEARTKRERVVTEQQEVVRALAQ